jgi:polar amino acid transport system substrate-binding protein
MLHEGAYYPSMKFSQCSALGLLAHQCLVFFVALCAICSTTNAQPIRLATHDQAPYGTYQPDNSFDGVAVRVIQCVFKRMGRAVQVEVYPWERAQLLAQNGTVQGFFPATIKPERLVWAEATTSIAPQKWVWFLRADSTLDPMAPEFKQTAKVGAHFGSNRLKLLEEKQYNVVLKPQTDEQLMLAFMRGRADAILAGDLAMAEAMKEHAVDPKIFRTVIAQDSPLHAYFGRKFLESDPDFIKRFNAAMPACAHK